MRLSKILSVLLIMLTLAATFTACNPFSGSQGTQLQQAQVTRGDLIVKVNGSGKATVSNDAKLTFGTGGKIDKLLVKKGDRVTKGMVIARLETDTLELAVSQAKTAEAQAEVGVSQAQAALSQALVVQTQTETAVQAATLALDKIKDVADLKDKINEIQWEIKVAEGQYQEAGISGDDVSARNWSKEIATKNADLANKQKDLLDLLGKQQYSGAVSASISDVLADKYGRIVVDDVRVKELQLTSAQQSVEQAKNSVEQAKKSVEQANRALEQAQKALVVAQNQLKDATITAPFDGVVASLDVKEGDVLPPPSLTPVTVIYLIDPGTMELNIDVDEIDVPSIKLNQKAIISLDALPDDKMDGKVTYISLVPGIQSSVVVYQTKVAFTVPPTIELRIGMSATADIVTSEHKNVLIVPSLAIKLDNQNKPYVDIIVNQNIEQKSVVTGVSDGIQIEIVSGLNEGDTVVIGKTPQGSGVFLK